MSNQLKTKYGICYSNGHTINYDQLVTHAYACIKTFLKCTHPQAQAVIEGLTVYEVTARLTGKDPSILLQVYPPGSKGVRVGTLGNFVGVVGTDKGTNVKLSQLFDQYIRYTHSQHTSFKPDMLPLYK